MIAPAGAGTLSGVAVSVDSTTADDLAATWTVSFSSSASGALDGSSGDVVTVVFPTGLTVAVPPVGASLAGGFVGACSAPPAIATGQSVEVDLPAGCSLPLSTQGTITFTGIDDAPGTYPASGFSVSSSQDATPVPATGSDIVIGGGGGGGGGGGPTQVSSVSFTPTDASAGATASWTVGFTTSDAGALAGGAGFGSVLVTFPAGFGTASSATFGPAFSCAGSHPVVQDVGGNTVELDLPTGCTLAASTPATVTLGGVANPGSSGSYTGAAVATSADIAPTSAAALTISAPPGAGPPAALVVSQQPAGATARSPFSTQPVVRVEDALGNLVTTSTSTIAVSATSCAGTLGGASLAAVGGIAGFVGLSVDAGGSCTLHFSDAADALSVDSAAFVVAKVATTTTVLAGPPVGFGTPVTLSAAVVGSSPTGDVAFAVDGATVGSAAVGGSVSIGSLAVGTHTVTASYAGDAANGASQGASQVVVERLPTTLVASVPSGPVVHGSPVTLAATGLPAAATGEVTFAVAGATLCTASVAGGGASCSASLPGGQVAVHVSYAGDASYAASAADLTLDVAPAAVQSLAVTAAKGAGNVVRTFALVAAGLPLDATGTVSFSVGGTVVCSAGVSNGEATCTGIVPAAGVVVAAYSGDVSYAAAQASTDVVVRLAPATVSIGAPAPGGSYADGDAVRFEATVDAGADDVPAPTGHVVFRVGGRAVCTATLVAGRAACTAHLAAAGSGETITASYEGDLFVAAASATERGPTVQAPPPTPAPSTTSPTPTTSTPTQAPAATPPSSGPPTSSTPTPPAPQPASSPPAEQPTPSAPATGAAPSEEEGLAVTLAAHAGAKAAGSRVTITASGLMPDSLVVVTVHSTPQVIARLRVGANGVLQANVPLPDGLEPGGHRLIVEGIGKRGQHVSKEVGFAIDGVGRFVLSAAHGASSLVEKIAAYTPSQHAHDVIGIFATWFALLAIAGAGGLAGGSLGASAPHESRRKSASLASAKTKVHKFKWEGQAPGDASVTWRAPGWSRLDAISFAVPPWLAKRSALAGRLLVDASYLRAMLGTLSLALPVAGIVLGTVAANGDARPPALGLLVALLVVGIADAFAGFLAGAAFVVVSALEGGFGTADSARTLLGVAALWFVVPLIAGAARPFRRPVGDLDAMDMWTRLADVVVASLLGAWATKKIVGAWAGLSGLHFPVIDRAGTLALVALGCIVARFVLETLCALFYPERVQAVQPPGKLPFAGRPHQIVSAVFRTALFVFVAIAFIGNCWQLWAAAALFLVPSVIAVYQDKLPNSERLYKLVPGGILKTVLMLFVGQWFFMLFEAHVAPESLLRDGFVFLGLPSLALMAAGLIGRDGDKREEGAAHQAGGTLVLLVGVLFVFGYFS